MSAGTRGSALLALTSPTPAASRATCGRGETAPSARQRPSTSWRNTAETTPSPAPGAAHTYLEPLHFTPKTMIETIYQDRLGTNIGKKASSAGPTLTCYSPTQLVRKRVFLRCHFILKVIILPRQARDKHRENSKTDRFLAVGGDNELTCKGAGVLAYCTGSFCDPEPENSRAQYLLRGNRRLCL